LGLKKSPKVKNTNQNPIANIPSLVRAVNEHISALSQLNNKNIVGKGKKVRYYGKYSGGRYIM